MCRPALDIPVKRLALLDTGRVGEDHIGGGGAQLAALFGVTGLENHRLALGRALDIQRAHHREVFALVIQAVQLARVEKLPSGTVAHKRIVFVRIPQPLHHLNVFGGTPVAGGIVVMFVAAVIAGGTGIATGHHVPAGAAFADQVQGGEAPGDVIGRVIRGGQRTDQADMPRAHGQCRQQGQRLQAIEVMGRRAFGDELAVDDEQQVEQRRLGLARYLDVPIDVDAGIGRQLRIKPQVMAARPTAAHGQGAQFELSFSHCAVVLQAVRAGWWRRRAARRLQMKGRTTWRPSKT